MAKRVRTLETLASLPYTTIDGGKWLKKALDPADIDTEVNGLPDTTTNQRTVLNYQFQADIPVPNNNTYVASAVQSYDADFYCYQNPITLGMSVSRPTGTKNPVGVPVTIDWANMIVTLPPGYSPGTVRVFLNQQIEGEDQNQKAESLKKYCQRYRMIYGGVQCIPACSALFDSGTIEATQQVFSPERKYASNLHITNGLTYGSNSTPDGTVYELQKFLPNDFPDEGSSIQNPTALYCRYKEGLYMPYKIRNPLVYDYRGSEQKALTEAPYVISDVVIFKVSIWANSTVVSTSYIQVPFDPALNSFKYTPTLASGQTATLDNIHFLCYTKTGIPFHTFLGRSSSVNNTGFENVGTIAFPDTLEAYASTKEITWQNLGWFMASAGFVKNFSAWYDPENPAHSESTQYSAVFDVPYQDVNVAVACFRSIGLQANIRVIFRFGLELMIVAGSVYSPFKHKAPKYDQKALSSYIRATHNMRDAFLGDAATPEGHALYSAHIAAIAAADDSGYISNQGSRWYGAVSV